MRGRHQTSRVRKTGTIHLKAHKLQQLTGPPITCDLSLESLSTVVTIPENLSAAEKFVLSKGLNFVSISKKLDAFLVKQEVEKFLRRVQLKAFFHDKERDDSNTSDKIIFETLQTRKPKWSPPEGQFASLDFFLYKCSHDNNKLNFNRNTKFSNLSSQQIAGQENLSKRKDIIFKTANKGGARLFDGPTLYQTEALRQLSDTSFYAKVEKDLTSTNQQTVESTIDDLIVKQELPAIATNLIITTPRTLCIYFLPKIH